ncbi:MAG: radical SAM protein [Candidatus Cloacimonadota bacterium]|nr:radical SAM protein [Candidatus Cloacimonadota bacterium]
MNNYNECQLCPRNCKVDRTRGELGYCGESDKLKISSICPHFGEEPPISGINGSGTVFFSGCSLKCLFCQNYQISIEGMGRIWSVPEVVDKIEKMYNTYKIHNVNFVTPDHFFPHTIEIVKSLRKRKINIPTLYNTSGYQKLSLLKKIKDYADIYMPDFKYSDSNLSKKLSNCDDYPEIAIEAISEMIRQKGFLDSFENNTNIAEKGVLVRHLILPENVKNSIDVLTTLFLEFGKNIPISLMSQYYPPTRLEYINLNKDISYLSHRIRSDAFRQIYEHAMSLGFKNMLVQFPYGFKTYKDKTDFVTDFRKKKPFKGK